MRYRLKQDTTSTKNEGSKLYNYCLWDTNKLNKKKREVDLIITHKFIKVWILH